MKSIVYILLAVLISSTLITAIPANLLAGNHTIRIECVDSMSSSAQLNESGEIIKQRLKDYGIKKFDLKVLANEKSILIGLKEQVDIDILVQLLTSNSRLEFYETYTFKEVVEKVGKNNKLFSLLSIQSNNNQPNDMDSACVLGHVKSASKGTIDSNISSIMTHLGNDANIKFKWSIYNKSSDAYKLFALHAESGISADNVADCNAGTDIYSGNAIHISFDKKGKENWKMMTKNSIGKSIAIVFDGKVYSAPKVMEAIENGKCLITGQFSQNEARLISSLINNPELPIDLKVVKY